MTPWHPLDYQNYRGSIGQYIQSQEDNAEINRDLPIDFPAPSNEAFTHMTHTLSTKLHFSQYSVH